MTYVNAICKTCNSEFLMPLKRFNYKKSIGENIYCCKDCSKHRDSTKIKCYTCGKEIWVSNTRIKRSKTGKIFCSKHCATIENNHSKIGKKHPNYKGGIGSYRRYALREFPHECAVCGWNEDVDVLQIHHIDENRKNNQKENLIILCPTCHFKITIGKYELTSDRKKIVLKE